MKSIKQLRREIALEEERSNKIIHEWFINNFSKDDPISECFASNTLKQLMSDLNINDIHKVKKENIYDYIEYLNDLERSRLL